MQLLFLNMFYMVEALLQSLRKRELINYKDIRIGCS